MIKLMQTNGMLIYIRPNEIYMIVGEPDGASVWMKGDTRTFYVKESPEEVQAKVNEHFIAMRNAGYTYAP